MRRNLEVLVSALEKDPMKLASAMNLECDALIVNQGNRDSGYEYENENRLKIRVFESGARGIGRSRNLALDKADSKIVLFSDDDIVYSKGYADSILKAFSSDPGADIIMFNVDVCEERRTYHIDRPLRVHKWSVGRYPCYAAAARLESIRKHGIRFSDLFGGGAKYSSGEDNLFFMDCLRAGLVIKAVPVNIGKEVPRKSTWFNGFNEKFFKDRGVLYSFLYGRFAVIWALRFVLAKRKSYENSVKPSDAFRWMKAGIAEGKRLVLSSGRKDIL
ncbi:MAG: glycosyltransferase family 2 protein [Saccharofermentans sp.]|nr:glycosyltransferase family 2 protein [Saccharofermentans sp.]